MADQNSKKGLLQIVIDVVGARKAIGELKGLNDGAAKSVGLVAAKFALLQAAVQGFVSSLNTAYRQLIASNEELNLQILKTQTALASSFRVFDAYGREIVDVGDKIDATVGTVTKAYKQLEKETADLAGLTSSQVIAGFNTVLVEGGRQLQNQTKKYASDIEGSIALTKGLLAGLVVEDLGTDRAAIELQTLLAGDLNNPAANLARKLNLSKSEIEQARASGELIDFLTEKFEVYIAAEKRLATGTIKGLSSNIQDFFEITSREIGTAAYDRVIESLASIEQFLINIKPQLAEVSAQLGDDLGQTLDLILETGKLIFNVLGPGIGESFKALLDVVDLVTDGFDTLSKGLQLVNTQLTNPKWLQDWNDRLDDVLAKIERITNNKIAQTFIPGVKEANSFAKEVRTSGTEAEELGNRISFIKEALKGIALPMVGIAQGLRTVQSGFKELNGETRQNIEALKTLSSTSKSLGNEADRYAKAMAEAKANGDTDAEAVARGKLSDILSEQYALQQEINELTINNSALEAPYKKAQEERLALLDEEIAKLEELGIVAGGVTFKNQELPKFGAALDELNIKLTNNISLVNRQGDGVIGNFKQAISEAQRLTGVLFDLGELDLDESVTRLRSLLESESLEGEERLAIEQQITALVQKNTAERVQMYKDEASAISTELKTGLIEPAEAATKQAEATQKQREAELDGLTRKLTELEATGTDQRQIEVTRSAIEALTNEVSGLVAETERLRLDEGVQAAQRAAEEAEASVSRTVADAKLAIQQGVDGIVATQGEVTQLLLQQEQEANAVRQQNLSNRIAAAQAAVQSAVGEQKRELQLQLDALQTEFANSVAESLSLADQLITAQKQAIEEVAQIASQANRDADTANQLALQRQIKLFGAYEEERSLLSAQSASQRAQEELRIAEQTLAEIQALPVPEGQEARIAFEQQLRDAVSARNQAELQGLQAINALDEQVRSNALRSLERQQRAASSLANIEQTQLKTSLEARRQTFEENESQLAIEAAQGAKDRAELEVTQAKQKEAELRRLSSESESARKALEQDLQQAIEQRYNTELSLLQAVGQVEQAVRARARAIIDGQLELLGQELQQADKRVSLQARANQLTLQGLSTQLSLEQAITGLRQAQLNSQLQALKLRERELQQQGSLTQALQEAGANEAREILRRLGELKLRGKSELSVAQQLRKNTEEQIKIERTALLEKHQAELRVLELKRLQLELQNEIAIAEAEQAALRERQTLKQLQLERQKAELIDDPDQRARTLANLDEQIAMQGDSIALADRGAGLVKDSANAQSEILTMQERQTSVQQSDERAQFEATAGERQFEARRNLARVRDQGRGMQAGGISSAQARQFGATARGSNASVSTPGVTNVYNAPLMSPGVARAMGI